MNPSSGNLHPTEGYFITGPVSGLDGIPGGVFHYTPKDHALELRSRIKNDEWNKLDLPYGTILIALPSIYWRESWKYGERAFRYCMHDVGHALGAFGIAASCLGWQVLLQDCVGNEDLLSLLGITDVDDLEAEHPDCLFAIFTDGEIHDVSISSEDLKRIHPSELLGKPNTLSADHVDWSIIYRVEDAASKPPTNPVHGNNLDRSPKISKDICRIIRKRRSAQVMDGQMGISLDNFSKILDLIKPSQVPFCPGLRRSYVDLVFFIHRVQGLGNGLYLMVRDNGRAKKLQEFMNPEFEWKKLSNFPADIDLYLLAQGDMRFVAQQASCHQNIADDGCFAVAMLAEFEEPLQEIGPWLYPRLYWECGMIGQMLYLGAEVNLLRGCGIGCFFDDFVHEILGLVDIEFQDFYHFAVGKALEDKRLLTLPAYD
ncbi:MAG: hypothetical protein MUO26_04850 [Methanotrichaceae archaeon]|nr:hypothetical protein [Methanotrichaceae archaeon]